VQYNTEEHITVQYRMTTVQYSTVLSFASRPYQMCSSTLQYVPSPCPPLSALVPLRLLWRSLVLFDPGWCCLVLSDNAWYCFVLFCTVWYCLVLFGVRRR